MTMDELDALRTERQAVLQHLARAAVPGSEWTNEDERLFLVLTPVIGGEEGALCVRRFDAQGFNGHARLTTTKLYAHATRQAMRASNQRHPLNAPDRECLTQEEMLERILAQVASLSDSASKNQARMEQMDAILTQLHGLHRPRLDSVSPG